MGESKEIDLDDILLRMDAKYNVSPEHLRRLLHHRRRWSDWNDAVEQARQRLELPEDIWEMTQDRAQVAALERTSRLLAMSEDTPSREAWIAGLKIWDGAFGIAYKKAEMHCKAKDKQHPRFAHYAVLLGRNAKLPDLPPHRWLAAPPGGEQEEVLQLQFTKDHKAMTQQGRFAAQ